MGIKAGAGGGNGEGDARVQGGALLEARNAGAELWGTNVGRARATRTCRWCNDKGRRASRCVADLRDGELVSTARLTLPCGHLTLPRATGESITLSTLYVSVRPSRAAGVRPCRLRVLAQHHRWAVPSSPHPLIHAWLPACRPPMGPLSHPGSCLGCLRPSLHQRWQGRAVGTARHPISVWERSISRADGQQLQRQRSLL